MSSSIDTIAAAAAPAVATPDSRARLGRRRFVDRLARWVVLAGGAAIIVSIVGIQLFILAEVWPLVRPAAVTPGPALATTSPVRALLVDEYRSHLVGLSEDGVVRVWRARETAPMDGGKSVLDALGGAAPSNISRTAEGHGLAAAAGGQVAVVPVSFETAWEDGNRSITPTIGEVVAVDAGKGRDVRAFSARILGDGVAVVAALEGGGIAVIVRESQENAITGETSVSETRREIAMPLAIEHVALDESRRNLYASSGSQLFWWSGLDAEPQRVETEAAVTALGFLYGERSLLVGDARGTVSVWFPVRVEGNDFQFTRIRGFEGESPVIDLVASPRDKGFFALEEGGRARLHNSTSERTMWTGTPVRGATAISYAPKADGAAFAGPDGIVPLAVDNPHPDISLKVLFGKVWYEGYDAPAWVWQSTGGTDDFEPKFSLAPLLFGTVKGTLYSLMLAIPLAVFGAMYTSQFMNARLRSWVKPAVELMAAFPSVVLGFMAGLWLAPRLEDELPALLLATIVLPVFVIAGGFAWTAVPRSTRRRFPVGTEVAVFAVAIVLGVWMCSTVAPVFERAVFASGFRSFVTQTLGLDYDQRNAIVVGLAMGFAVIPIIFAISEDAFSNVPASLTSASLALGASRWQTVSRVVLPAASPGIFSAVMVGFGRAVGETMIVLMATGNTPIMDWNAFNGFRTLSANIAVEIPEAPHGATLYRTLFLAALLLFAMTFAVNTIAELVRQRLRRKYSEA